MSVKCGTGRRTLVGVSANNGVEGDLEGLGTGDTTGSVTGTVAIGSPSSMSDVVRSITTWSYKVSGSREAGEDACYGRLREIRIPRKGLKHVRALAVVADTHT